MSFGKFAVATAVASFAMTSAAFAEDGHFYVSVGGGLAWVDDVETTVATLDFDTGYSVNAAVGYQSADAGEGWEGARVRADVEVFYSDSDTDKLTAGGVSANVTGGLENTGVLANAYIDFFPGSVVRPYVGAGVGFVDTDLTVTGGGTTAAGSSTEFAYRLATGASYDITDTIAIDLGYRYLAVNTNSETDTHHVVTSLRFGF
jgi:OmpA-OmpF porin, OOP family